MKQFRCGDLIPGCDASFRGTENEILAAVSGHAATAHGLASVPPELVAQVRALLTDVG